VTPYEAWFTRPSEGTAVDVEVVLRDALGRVSVRSATVPAGAIDPPVITVLASWVSAPYLVARWTTDTPADDGTGPFVLTVVGTGSRFFPPPGPRPQVAVRDAVSAVAPGSAALGPRPIPIPFPPLRISVRASFSMPSIRAVSAGPLLPIDVDVVREVTGAVTVYTAAVRVPAGGSMTLSIATPAGQVGSTRIAF
jgi:hypothetical protein